MKEKTLWKVYFIIIAIVMIIIIFSCRKPEFSDDCCWICKTKVIDYKPQPGIEEVMTIIKYSDSVFCNCTDEFIKNWEIVHSDTLYIEGMRREIVSKCKK